VQQTETSGWQFVFRTDPGRIRELNEDNCLCEPELDLWCVADGMGGHSCGEVASAVAVSSIGEATRNQVALSEAIQMAHKDILDAARDGKGADGMGTTIVALRGKGDSYEIAWVGDSRAYLWRPRMQKLIQLTQDHSLVERLLTAGLISKDEAKSHPQRHLITQCLGSKELEAVKVDVIQKAWEPDDVVLLCSDGLTEELTDDDMKTIFTAQPDLDKTADRLLRMALNKGGQDNISFVLLRSPIVKPSGFAGIVFSIKRLFLGLTGKR